MSDTPISPPSGAIALAGVAPNGFSSRMLAPLTAALLLAAAAPAMVPSTNTAIAPTVGSVALAGMASTVGRPTSTVMTPTAAALAVAGVAPAFGNTPTFQKDAADNGLATWTGLQNGVAGGPVQLFNRGSFQVTGGVFGSGGSISLQGSNDGINWAALSPTALTSAGFFAALGANEKPRFVRPIVTAGDATTSLNVSGWLSS